MNRNLFLAILGMDSYNRGYGVGINSLDESGQLGNATLLAATNDQKAGWEAAGFYAMAFFTPTILSAFGFSVALSQILQTPPYMLAAICSIVTGYWGDKIHRRSPFMLGHSVVVIVGFLLMGWGPNTGGKLTGVFLSIAGVQCIIPTVLTFMSNNIASVKHRKVGIALQVVMGAIGGLVGSLIFRAKDAPKYRPGMYAAFALIVLFMINVVGVTEYFRRQNKKADEEGLIIDGVEGFRYTL